MIAIVTALHCEAKPLIAHYRLKREMSFSGQQLFSGENMLLIQSGMGKVRSAVATARLIERAGKESGLLIVNLGICGSSGSHPIGSLQLINRITDHGSGRSFYPDILHEHDLPENALETRDMPVLESPHDGNPAGLVDMEAAGFFEAAALFLGPERILCLKIVSDHFSLEKLSPAFASELMDRNMGRIQATLGLFAGQPAEPAYFSEHEQTLIDACCAALKLTASQRTILLREARCCKISSGGIAPLEQHSFTAAPDKREAKRCFSALIKSLRDGTIQR